MNSNEWRNNAAYPNAQGHQGQSNRWTSYDARPTLSTSSTDPSQAHALPSWTDPSRQRPHTTVGIPLPPLPPGAGLNHPPFAHHAQSDPTSTGLSSAGASSAQYGRFMLSTPVSGGRPLPSPSYPPAPPLPSSLPRHGTSDSVNSLPGYFGGPGDFVQRDKSPDYLSRPDISSGSGSQTRLSQWNPSLTDGSARPPLPRKDFSAEASSSVFSPPPPLPPKIHLHDPSNPFNDEHQNDGPVEPLQVSPRQPVDLPSAIASEPGASTEVDEELERVLRMSMETFAVESQRPHTDEDEEARVMRESAEMFAKQQEMDQMGTGDDGEDIMARIYEMSLADAVMQQKQIEMEIKRSSQAHNSWGGFRDENGAGPSRPSRQLDVTEATLGSVTPVRASPIRPRIITSATSSANPSRATTPQPSNAHSSPEHARHLSPTSAEWGDMSLPAYEEVLSSPSQPPSHESPIRSSSGLGATLGTPALSPMSAAESLSPGRSASTSFSSMMVASPIDASPQASYLPSPHMAPSHELASDDPHPMLRPHSKSFHVSHIRNSSSTSLGRSPSSPSTGALSRESSDRRQHAAEHGSSNTSRSSSQPSMARPHTMYTSNNDIPPMPPMPMMPMPQPTFPEGMPQNSPLPSFPNGSDPASGGKRIVVETEYVDGVSFGWTPPLLDQPVLPPPPPFPDTITLLPKSAFHISARTWHQLIRLLARLGAVMVQPSPEAYRLLPQSASALSLRLIVHFHKCNIGKEWRTVLWLDLDRPLPSTLETSRFTNGDTTVLPFGCKIPEESIGPHLRGPGPMDIVSSMTDILYVVQTPLPMLPISLGNLATVLHDAYRLSKDAVSTGSGPSSDAAVGIDRGLSQKRLHKAIEKIYPANKRIASVAVGVVRRGENRAGDGEASKVVAVGGKRTFTGWLRTGMGKVVPGREERGGQHKNEEDLADLVTPYSFN